MQNICCFILLIMLSACGSSDGQISDKAKDLAKANFQQKYPDEKNAKWGTDDAGNYEAKFKEDGETYRVDFDKNGNWVETENTIKYKNLPDAVKDAIKRDYDKDDIVEVERVESAKKGLFFDVEFKKKGKKHDVEYNSAGAIIGRE